MVIGSGKTEHRKRIEMLAFTK